MSGPRKNKRRGNNARRQSTPSQDAKGVEPEVATAKEAEAAEHEPDVVVQEMPVVPRTNASKISAAAIDQALAASADSELPKEPATTDSDPKRETVNPHTLAETTNPAELIALPRTMSEEWMAAEADDGAYEQSSRPRWIVPALLAGIAAVGVLAVLAFHGGNDSSATTRAVANDGSAATQVAVVQALDAAIPVAVVMPADAAEVVLTPDAAEAAIVPIDAPQVAVAPDAAILVAAVPVDAAMVPVDAKPAPTPDAAVEPKPVTPKEPKPVTPKEPKPVTPKEPKPVTPKEERTIEQLVDASEFAKANAACAANTIFSTPRLTACTIAACNAQSPALATRWIRALPRASRDEMVEKCKSLGVEVTIP